MKWMTSPGPLPARFLSKLERRGECLVWTKATDRKGYGRVGVGPAHMGTIGAHVWACLVVHGPRPSSKHMVLHSCNNPPCCEPTHLRWGLARDNTADMIAAGNGTPSAETCGKGHPQKNNRYDNGGCITCGRERAAARRQACRT